MAVVRELAAINQRAGTGVRRLNIWSSLIVEQNEFKQSTLGLLVKKENLALLCGKRNPCPAVTNGKRIEKCRLRVSWEIDEAWRKKRIYLAALLKCEVN